jgi:hypothetical protein
LDLEQLFERCESLRDIAPSAFQSENDPSLPFNALLIMLLQFLGLSDGFFVCLSDHAADTRLST